VSEKQKYILVDAMNMFHRAKHVVHNGDIDTRIGMALHIMFNSLRKGYRDLGGQHIVYCLEGHSWRKGTYKKYKANRVVAQLAKSQREREDDELFFEAFNDLNKFILEKTNATVLQCPVGEADDLIAMWIDLHPENDHIIISSDSDFVQLLAPNVEIYNGVTNVRFTHNAAYNDKGQKLEFEVKTDGKIKVGKPDGFFEHPMEDWTEFAMFLKCIRGDKSDNIFPAYPGARIKGSKNKSGITEAFNDRHDKSYDWNNFMLQTWTDVDGNECVVKDQYDINRTLIDLRLQPEDIKEMLVQSIIEETVKERKSSVGINFMRFCSSWDLAKISKYPDEYAIMLNTPYRDYLLEVQKEIA
jgi:5'-3' exonuclease